MTKRFYSVLSIFSIVLAAVILAPLIASAQPAGSPADYFPTKTGQRWEYNITLGISEPIQFRLTSWPMGEKVMNMVSRSRFRVAMDKNRQKFPLKLITRVKGPVEKAGPYKWAPVELAIEKDDLGVYEDAKKVFLIHTADYALALQVVTCPADGPGAPRGGWGGWGQEDGYSSQLMFFASRPGIQKSSIDDDALLFVGFDGPYLRFRRTVKSHDESRDPSILDAGFTEDMWYAKGKGLVKLEQKVNGKISMTWKLMDKNWF